MNKALGAVFGLIGAILLFLPVAAIAGPLNPGEPIGTHVFCGKTTRISAALGRTQPIRAHSTGNSPCLDIISISDTRINITLIGDGGLVTNGGTACGDNQTKILGEDPSASDIIAVRGRNITITGFEITGQRSIDVDLKRLHLVNGVDLDLAQCFANVTAASTTCNNSRGIRVQRGGTLLVGRNVTVGAFSGDTDPKMYLERSGNCIHHMGKSAIEATQGTVLRAVNNELHDTGTSGILVSETSTATLGFTSGGETGLTSDPFPGPGFSGPNFIHDNASDGIAVQRNAFARILGNTIVHNRNGVAVTVGAGAEVADNLINQNTRFGVLVDDNSNVNLGTTVSSSCTTTVGTPCPGPVNAGGTTSGVVTLTGLANTVTVANTSGGLSCTRSYMAGRSNANRTATGSNGLSQNAGGHASVFTTCVSNLN